MVTKKILETFKNSSLENSPPIWIMRQAGRYLPEYRKVREKAGNFLNLCYNPLMAAEVTMQPIKKFDFDAAIIFSDILIIPHSLGLDVTFEKGEGPRVEIIAEESDLKRLKIKEECEKLGKVYDAIALVKQKLPENKALIGFSGGPWTVATYVLEGRGKHDFSLSREIASSRSEFLRNLIAIITESTINHLLGQIRAGADIIQIFDSWAGLLSGEEYERFVIEPTKIIIKAIREKYKDIPIIGFPRGSSLDLYEKYISATKVDAISVSQDIDLKNMKKWKENLVVQGNLDPAILLSSEEEIAKNLDLILESLGGKNFIFNLGHGILPETPIKNVTFLVSYIREYKQKNSSSTS